MKKYLDLLTPQQIAVMTAAFAGAVFAPKSGLVWVEILINIASGGVTAVYAGLYFLGLEWNIYAAMFGAYLAGMFGNQLVALVQVALRQGITDPVTFIGRMVKLMYQGKTGTNTDIIIDPAPTVTTTTTTTSQPKNQ